MNRREFVKYAPASLLILPSLPDTQAGSAETVSNAAFQRELRRRFEELPAFLKSETFNLHLAAAVALLDTPTPQVALVNSVNTIPDIPEDDIFRPGPLRRASSLPSPSPVRLGLLLPICL